MADQVTPSEGKHAYGSPMDLKKLPNAARGTCWVGGVVFLIIAIWGFFTGDTVLGVFTVNVLHNWVHLLSGLLLFAGALGGEDAARLTLWVLAAIYALVMLLGFAGITFIVDALELNAADHWLHLALTLALAGGAVLSHYQQRVVERGKHPVQTS